MCEGKEQRVEIKMSLSDSEVRSLVCELCRNFYTMGWVTGTGGSISIRRGEHIYMTPSGVQKERIKPEELFVVDKAGKVVQSPSKGAKLSDCAPLFLHAYNQRDAGKPMYITMITRTTPA